MSPHFSVNPEKLQKTQKIGCEFTAMTGSLEDTVQRYMHQIQPEDLQKELHLY